jgi:hypothetical protein
VTLGARLLRLAERHLGGHLSLGPITVYGFNAMHLAVNIRSPLGYVCFHPGWGPWPWSFYVSANATPWGAWLVAGPAIEREDRARAASRRENAVAWLLESDWREVQS